MKTKRSFLTAALVGIGSLVSSASPAGADFFSKGFTHIYGADDWTLQAAAPVSHSAAASGGYLTSWEWGTAAEVYADAQHGLLRAGSFQTLIVHKTSSASSYFAWAETSFHDTFTIQAGDSNLPAGMEVQIRFRASVEGDVSRVATGGDSATALYTARLWRGGTKLAELDYEAIHLYPPNDFDISEVVDQLVTVRIGDTLTLNGTMYADMNNTGNGNPGSYAYWIDMTGTGQAQLGYAPGYENIRIVSDAGAEILPEPMTLGLLAVGGLALLRHRGSHPLRS